MLDCLQAARDQPKRGVFSCGPQTGKSELLLHALVWVAWNRPGSASGYVTYGDDIAHLQARRAWAIAERAGLDPTGSEAHIRLKNGSIIHFAAFGGPIEGFPIDGLLIVDDPYRDRESAWSEAVRANVKSKFFGTLMGRVHDNPSIIGTSIIVCGHRWSPFDLQQELADAGWNYKNYPTLQDKDGNPDIDGESFAPWLKSKKLILEQKALLDSDDIFAFDGEYQGNPTPRGSTLFDCTPLSWKAHEYDSIPADARYFAGMDLAYTESTAADFSVAIVIALDTRGVYYVVDVLRGKWSDVNQFKALYAAFRGKHPKGPVARWDTSAQETATARLLGISPVKIPAGFKIYQRSMTAVARWAAKELKVPRSATWMPAFKKEMTQFTGQDGGGHDDQIAALASAIESSRFNPSKPGMVELPNLDGW